MRVVRPLSSWLTVLTLGAVAGADPPGPRQDAEGTRQLIGRVVKATPELVQLEHMGAVVAFKVTSDTEFTGLGARSSRDLAEGQQVLATFVVEDGTTNVATRISATTEAMGEPRRR